MDWITLTEQDGKLIANVKFGFMEHFMKSLAEFTATKIQSVSIQTIVRDLSRGEYIMELWLPHGDYLPIKKFFKQ